MASVPPLIACIEASEPVAVLLHTLLAEEGYRVVICTPPPLASPRAITDFLREVRPQVVLYDIAPPYTAQWQGFRRVQAALPACPFVLMTTNKRFVDALADPTAAIETLAKPFDVDDLLAALRRGLAGSIQHATVAQPRLESVASLFS